MKIISNMLPLLIYISSQSISLFYQLDHHLILFPLIRRIHNQHPCGLLEQMLDRSTHVAPLHINVKIKFNQQISIIWHYESVVNFNLTLFILFPSSLLLYIGNPSLSIVVSELDFFEKCFVHLFPYMHTEILFRSPHGPWITDGSWTIFLYNSQRLHIPKGQLLY
jgi:hypothetical protein